jgi:type IV secretory pathway ATPase VirB11/archaellum biosynthesis ATPase
LTRAINRLDDGITWFIEYESQGKQDVMTIHADSQKEALERMASRMDAPFTIMSISAI